MSPDATRTQGSRLHTLGSNPRPLTLDFTKVGIQGMRGGDKKSGVPNGTLKHCCSPLVQP